MKRQGKAKEYKNCRFHVDEIVSNGVFDRNRNKTDILTQADMFCFEESDAAKCLASHTKQK